MSSPPFSTLVPLLLLAASFHCSVACLVRSLALQQPRQLCLRQVADVDHEFRVGGPSTRKELVYDESEDKSSQPSSPLGSQKHATTPDKTIGKKLVLGEWRFVI